MLRLNSLAELISYRVPVECPQRLLLRQSAVPLSWLSARCCGLIALIIIVLLDIMVNGQSGVVVGSQLFPVSPVMKKDWRDVDVSLFGFQVNVHTKKYGESQWVDWLGSLLDQRGGFMDDIDGSDSHDLDYSSRITDVIPVK